MSKLIIKALSDNPYAPLVCDFIGQAFPANLDNAATTVDAVAAAVLASSQTRFGPMPTPEGQVALRDVIRYWTEKREPIIVMVPWGSKKTVNTSSIDIAELAALKQVVALNDRVRRFYEPGIIANLRIENLGGQYLWRDEGLETVTASNDYVQDLKRLVRILDVPFILPVLESDNATKVDFDRAADRIYPYLESAIAAVHATGADVPAGPDLKLLGWIGDPISHAMVQYYLDSYAKLYPHMTDMGRVRKLAVYFAQSAARYAVGANGVKNVAWIGHFTQINFALPTPGIPTVLANRRLFYRTLPLKYAKTHLPPWRAKGYFRVNDGATVTPKLASWNDPSVSEHEPMLVEFSDGNERVQVRADLHLT